MFELELTSMTYGGSALGRHEGKVIFVPYAIAGEQITADITQDKGKFANATVVKVLQPSEHRIEPRCAHFGACGGCQWQHIEYSAQLEFKRQIVIEQFARIGGLRAVMVHPMIPSPDAWEYRTHVNFHTTQDGKLGFVGIDRRTVIPIEECHIMRPPLRRIFEILRENTHRRNSRLRLQVGSDGKETVATMDVEDEEEEVAPAQKEKRSKTRRSQPEPQETQEPLGTVHYTVFGREFQVTGGSFFQVNLKQAENLVNLVMHQLALTKKERVLDLFAGVGMLTAFIAEEAAGVTAIEISPTAIQDAQVNLRTFKNVDLIAGSVEEMVPNLRGLYDFVVMDPPRTGVKEKTLEALAQMEELEKIVYVSLDPSTLARDAKILGQQGFHLVDVQPIDMFPHTFHIEAVAVFQRGA